MKNKVFGIVVFIFLLLNVSFFSTLALPAIGFLCGQDNDIYNSKDLLDISTAKVSIIFWLLAIFGCFAWIIVCTEKKKNR